MGFLSDGCSSYNPKSTVGVIDHGTLTSIHTKNRFDISLSFHLDNKNDVKIMEKGSIQICYIIYFRT